MGITGTYHCSISVCNSRYFTASDCRQGFIASWRERQEIRVRLILGNLYLCYCWAVDTNRKLHFSNNGSHWLPATASLHRSQRAQVGAGPPGAQRPGGLPRPAASLALGRLAAAGRLVFVTERLFIACRRLRPDKTRQGTELIYSLRGGLGGSVQVRRLSPSRGHSLKAQ